MPRVVAVGCLVAGQPSFEVGLAAGRQGQVGVLIEVAELRNLLDSRYDDIKERTSPAR